MFSRRTILKLLGIGAAAPAVVAEAVAAPVYEPVSETLMYHGVPIRIVDTLSVGPKYVPNDALLARYRSEAIREYIRADLFKPYTHNGESLRDWMDSQGYDE